jgi:hypothetical protein
MDARNYSVKWSGRNLCETRVIREPALIDWQALSGLQTVASENPPEISFQPANEVAKVKAIRIALNSMFPVVLALYLISTALAVVHNVRASPMARKTRQKGLILSRNGDLIDVREDGADRIVVVVLDDDTQVKLKKKGPLGIISRKQSMDVHMVIDVPLLRERFTVSH